MKPASRRHRCVSCGPMKTRGDQPTSSGVVSRATASMTSRTRAMLPSARPQRLGQPCPEAIVIGDPVHRRRRDDRVDRLVQLKVEHILAPHVCAVAEAPARECNHLRRRVHGQHASPWHECQQRLGDAPGAAADVHHCGVVRDPLEPCEDLRGPRLLRLARLVIRARVPGSAHHGVRLPAGDSIPPGRRNKQSRGVRQQPQIATGLGNYVSQRTPCDPPTFQNRKAPRTQLGLADSSRTLAVWC